jgi:SPP1 family predicted phage head-tail adaptor
VEAVDRVNPGELRSRVVVQSATRTTDAGGGFATTWADGASLWAKVEPLEGSELLRAQQLQARVTHRVTIRYRRGLTAASRLRLGARVLDIQQVIDVDERHQFTELLCEEVAA